LSHEDEDEAEAWIRAQVEPAGPIEVVHERPWATVRRVPIAGGVAWFKACAPVQAFEPRLTAALAGRWPERLPEVLAYDEERAWLLLGDAGERLGFAPARSRGCPSCRFTPSFSGARRFSTGPWLARLRDAYLEPSGRPTELRGTFELAQRLGVFGHVFKELRVLDSIPEEERGALAPDLPALLARCVATAD
jgi:hypothetical protein